MQASRQLIVQQSSGMSETCTNCNILHQRDSRQRQHLPMEFSRVHQSRFIHSSLSDHLRAPTNI